MLEHHDDVHRKCKGAARSEGTGAMAAEYRDILKRRDAWVAAQRVQAGIPDRAITDSSESVSAREDSRVEKKDREALQSDSLEPRPTVMNVHAITTSSKRFKGEPTEQFNYKVPVVLKDRFLKAAEKAGLRPGQYLRGLLDLAINDNGEEQ